MVLTFLKKLPVCFIKSQVLFVLTITALLLSGFLSADIIQVTNNDGGLADGSLNAAIQQAQAGDIIDCSPIAGQTINVSVVLPALGPSLTILGSGVTIDGGSSLPVFSLAQGSATITDFSIQNGLSQGGNGGSGLTGGGGGTGGGGALYIHSGTTMTISTLGLNNNQAIGGTGGAGNVTGGSGGGGGGFHGGSGGAAINTGASAGAGGGGGGNSGGAHGGTLGAGSPNVFPNFAGGGGGGEIPARPAGSGGNVAATSSTPARSGGAGGQSSATNGAGAGGGAGSGGSGSSGSDAINATPSGTGIGGAGGLGVGTNNAYGGGGGGGGGNGGGAGYGTGGGGGGLNGPGGAGGLLGGGGGASSSNAVGRNSGGDGGFGAGGGGGHLGGVDTSGIGGAGGSATNAPAGGGGGSGLGGAIFIQQGGTLIIQDGVNFSGNSTTAGLGGTATGIGSSGQGGSSLGKDLFIQSGGSITFQLNNTLTLSNPIEGAGLLSEATGPGLTKSGIGTLYLSGDNTYLGGTIVQSGMMNLNGSIGGDLHIQSGSIFSGNATVNGTIFNGGTISPGNSIGTVFTTNLTLSPTSIYNVEINSAGNSDIIIASGSAQVDGSVIVSPDDTNFRVPHTYTIISTSGGVTGQFSSLASPTPSLKRLIYNPLTVQLTYFPLSAIPITGNAKAAGNCFTTLAGLDALAVNSALLALNPDDIQSAFEQMSPAQFSGPTQVQLLDAILIRSTYTKHLQKYYFNVDQHDTHPLNVWIDGIAQWQNQGKLFGYKDTTFGSTIGLDYHIYNWILGCALSATYDHFHWKRFAGNAKINSYYGGLYGRWNHDALYLDLAVLGAFSNYKTTRHLNFGSIDRCAYSKHHGNEWLTHLGLEYWIRRSGYQVTPYFNLDYVLQHEHGYAEWGADSLDLQLDRKKSRLFQGEAGVSLSTSCHVRNGVFTPMLSLAYINQTPCSSKDYHANFLHSCCTFTGRGGSYGRNLFVPRLALIFQNVSDKASVSIYYDGQIGNKYRAQDIAFDVTVRF